MKRWLWLTILLLALALRVYRLEGQSFWNDEGNSARLSERPIPDIISGTASDIHPPLYYLLLHGWRGLVGETEFALRAFSVLAGVGTVAVTLALGQAAAGRGKWGGMVAGLVTAVSPPLIYYSQETRMYSLLAGEAVLATWLLRQTVDWFHLGSVPSVSPHQYRYWLAYGALVTAGLYTHYFFPAVLLAHGGWMLYRTGQDKALRRQLLWFALTGAGALLLYAPWLPIFWRQAGGRPSVRGDLGEFLTAGLRWLAFGHTITSTQVAWSLLAVGLLVGLGLAYGRIRALLPLLMTALPLLFMYLVGATQPEFFKFLLVSVPFLALLVGSSFRMSPPLIPLLLFLPLLWGNGRALQNLYFNPTYARADYRGMALRIAADAHPNAGIILDAPNQWEAFTYYHRQGAPVYPLPQGQPQPERLAAALTQITAQHRRLYAIFWGEAQRDPERLVERWLDAHAFKATDEWVGDVRFVMYAVPPATAREMETAVALPFGDHITLDGYTLPSTSLPPGDILPITLFWHTDAPLETRYKVFLHLIDAHGLLQAQRDSEPGGGLTLTTLWSPETPVIDNHGLLIPPQLPPGNYTLLLGLYDLTDPTHRLPIQTPEGVVDALTVTTVLVEK